MKKVYFLILPLLLLSACKFLKPSGIDKTLNEGKPLVRVGDEKIHEGYLDLLQRVNPGIKAQLETPMGKKRLIDNLVEQELFYQESVKRGLDKRPSVIEKADLYKRVIIAQSLLDDELEKKAKEFYDQNKDKEFERVKISQIFFSNVPKLPPPLPGKMPSSPTEEDKKKADEEAAAKAKQAYDRLQKGEAWASVVNEMSDDKGSAAHEGDMGYLTRADRRIERLDYQPLINAAFALAKGAYSQPIQAKDGWHIIQVTEEKQIQPYNDVAMSIKFKVRGEVKNNLMAELKNKMKVQYLDVSLVESMPAMHPPIPMPESAPKALETKPAESKPVESRPLK